MKRIVAPPSMALCDIPSLKRIVAPPSMALCDIPSIHGHKKRQPETRLAFDSLQQLDTAK